MKINIRKDLFKIFQENKDEYDLYEKVVNYIESKIETTKGEENAEFYYQIMQLENSINNAGWEDRHSQQIQKLWDIQNNITGRYEKYLS